MLEVMQFSVFVSDINEGNILFGLLASFCVDRKGGEAHFCAKIHHYYVIHLDIFHLEF